MNQSKRLFLLSLLFLLSFIPSLLAQNYVVTNEAESGLGSLDAAIEYANESSDPDTILFNIPGDGPFYLTGDHVFWYPNTVLDATSQPDYYLGKIVIGTDEENLGDLYLYGRTKIYGIKAGLLSLTGSNTSQIGMPGKGNVLGMIYLEDSNDVIIQSNKIGTNAAGTESAGTNSHGIEILNCEDVLVGGDSPEEGNLISGNDNHGMRVIDMIDGVIRNNKIGTDITGTYAIPNGNKGISAIVHHSITIGGEEGMGNLISGNLSGGISTGSATFSGCLIANNKIGTDITGLNPIPNEGNGISLSGQTPVVVQENIIAFNTEYGLIVNDPIINEKHLIENSFFCNNDGGYFIDKEPLATILILTDSLISGISNAAESTIELFFADTLTCIDKPCQGQQFIASVTTDALGDWTFEGDFEAGYYIVNGTPEEDEQTSRISGCQLLEEVEIPSSISKTEENAYFLNQNTPNPFSKETSITFTIPKNTEVVLQVFNINGDIILEQNHFFLKGENGILINKMANFPSGLYFYSLNIDGNNFYRKMIKG